MIEIFVALLAVIAVSIFVATKNRVVGDLALLCAWLSICFFMLFPFVGSARRAIETTSGNAGLLQQCKPAIDVAMTSLSATRIAVVVITFLLILGCSIKSRRQG